MSDQKHHSSTTSVPARPSRGTVVAAAGAVGLVAIAALAGAAPAQARTSPAAAAHVFGGALTDLQPATAGPLDGARAKLVFVQHRSSSTFILVVSGVGPAHVGETYGAHLHTGACVAGNGTAAGPHYNQSTVQGVVPPVVSNQTEVWLDVTIGADGSGVAVAKVPFVPTPGNRSVVIHAEQTNDHGTAGARQACLPVSWS
jgi:Cu/Zn superoxide dismutase